MIKIIVKVIILVGSLIILASCSSVEKYNAQISKKHSPTELKEDVDYAYEKLQKLHPNLYQYISKEKLENNFENLKKSLIKPLSSIEFFKKISPVIASIGQGHTAIYSPHKKQTKEEIKKKGKRGNMFNTLRFTTLNNKIYVDKGFGKDSLMLRGTELLKIEGGNVEDLVASYQNIGTGDGFIKNFIPEYTRKKIQIFYGLTNTLKDSLQLTLKNKDSVYTKYLYAFVKKKKKTEKKKDSLKVAKKVLTKIEKKIAKKKKKERSEWNYNHGYDKFTKESVRNFEFLDNDSKKVAYMKIRGFHKYQYEDFYDDVFKQIDSAKVDNLVIDLRDNTGGRLAEIAYIYSYLTDKEHQFILPGKMTRANSWMYPTMHNKATVLQKSIRYMLFPVMKVVQAFKVKKIEGKPHFHFKSSKVQKPKEEHNYKGKVYVLINAISFSASAVLSNKLQATKRAFFVGDETGGAYNSTVAGRFALIILPNSKEILRVGVMVLETPHKTTPDGYGVKPDKYIPITTLDKDEQLDWILEDISKSK
ncbi:MAG TPA: peptidase S41 [Flavobacteriaceae bacterium]|nr:peptidase S41 [Flavobacteriaceae bacterium]